MNIDHLRWILAGCGLLLILGIYLWERFRRKAGNHRRRFLWGNAGLPAADFTRTGGAHFDEELDLPSMRADSFDPLFADIEAAKMESETAEAESAAAESHEPDGPLSIVQIKVTAQEGNRFPGTRLIRALREAGLEFGSMDIFHKRYDGTPVPLFSVVNLVEPGTFPVEDPSHFESPGVVFFLQVAVCDQPLVAFDEMIRTVRILAARLDGEVRDEDNELLTVEKTESIREALLSVAGWSSRGRVDTRP